MKPRTVILLIVAVVCGLAAALFTARLIAVPGRDDRPDEWWVVKPDDGIKQGTKIDKPENFFEKKADLKGNKPKGALDIAEWPTERKDEKVPSLRGKQLKDKFLNKALAKGQFVTEKDFAGADEPLPVP